MKLLSFQSHFKLEVQNDLTTEVGHSRLKFWLKKISTYSRILLQVGIYVCVRFYRHIISRGRRKSEDNFDFESTASWPQNDYTTGAHN